MQNDALQAAQDHLRTLQEQYRKAIRLTTTRLTMTHIDDNIRVYTLVFVIYS